MTREEDGVVTVWGAALVALLALVAVVSFALVSVVAGHRRAQSGADLAALAGAGSLRDGEAACPSAARIAARHGAELVRCELDGWRVRVVVQLRLPGLLGHEHVVRGRAVAGPG